MKKLLVLFCTLLLTAGLTFAQTAGTGKKSKTGAKKAAAESAAPAEAIAVHEFKVEGVDVALMEVTRTAPDTVTVKWEYRNKTAQPAELADDAKGWSDPYRLSWDTYLLLSDGKTKAPVMRDSGGKPIAAVQGSVKQLKITVAPKKKLKNRGQNFVPPQAQNLTVVVNRVETVA